MDWSKTANNIHVDKSIIISVIVTYDFIFKRKRTNFFKIKLVYYIFMVFRVHYLMWDKYIYVYIYLYTFIHIYIFAFIKYIPGIKWLCAETDRYISESFVLFSL